MASALRALSSHGTLIALWGARRTDTAYATLIAVELPLAEVIVEEVARRAEIRAQIQPTLLASLRWLLLVPTVPADDRSHTVAIDGVSFLRVYLLLVLGKVMAESAREDLATARCAQLTVALIVFAPVELNGC